MGFSTDAIQKDSIVLKEQISNDEQGISNTESSILNI
jgi:hypothetical protein